MIIKTVSKRQPSICFHCRRDFEIRTYPVINACETPEIALELIEERYFTDVCPHCGKMAISFAYPTYYFDVERNIALVYSPYWQQAKKMAEEIVPVPIGKNGKRIKIKTFTQWSDFFSQWGQVTRKLLSITLIAIFGVVHAFTTGNDVSSYSPLQ